MNKFVFTIGILVFSVAEFSAQKKDSIKTREIEDLLLHKTGNPNKAIIYSNKSNLGVMENPQSTAIVTHEIIEQQQAQQVSDVVKNVNGVYLTSSRGSTQDSFGARGYVFGNDNIFKNGSRTNSGLFPEVSGLERVEVLKGSAAILFGNVAAGGIVNMITKKPRFNFGGQAAMNLGSWNNYKPSIDVYGPLSKTIAFRVNGTYENKESFRDIVASEKHYFNPSFLFQLSDKTQVIVEGDYLKHNFTPDFGLGTLMDQKTGLSYLGTGLKINQFVGASWQYSNSQMATSSITLNHQFNKNWSLNSIAAYQNYTRDYYSTERVQWVINPINPIQNPERSWQRPLNKIYTEQNYASLQFNINGEFKTGFIKHKLLVGADGDYGKTDTYAFNNPKWYGTDGNTNTPSSTNPNYILLDNPETWVSGAIPLADKTNATITPIQRLGVYAQDLFDLGKFKVLAGARFSYIDNKNTTTKNFTNNTELENENKSVNRAISPRLGVVYQENDQLSFFASYSNSFVPNTGLDIKRKALSPSVIDQYEVGVKHNFFNSAVATNLTIYQIDNSNLSQPSQEDINFRELTGQTRSRGVEVDITGNPTPQLSLIAGGSYNHMVYTRTPDSPGSFVEGERLVRTPSVTANASVFYTFIQQIKGLKLGLTAFYTGDRMAGWNNTKGQSQVNRLLEIGGFTTIDFSAGYAYKKFLLQAKLGNVFDVLNYNIHENYSVNPIMPRNYYFTLTYKL